MKNLSAILAALLISTGANASQQLSFSGHLIYASGAGATLGESISGQFTFNPESPELAAYQTSPYPRLELSYLTGQSSSLTVNGGQPIVGNDKIDLHFMDNFTINQALIDQLGFTKVLQAGIYDAVDISSASWAGIDKVSYYFMALFAADTVTEADIQNKNYQGIFSRNLNPLFLGFRIQDTLSGAPDFAGAGVVEHANITTVPLPSAAWLFGSAFAGLALRLRKRG